ncbi:MAG: hypothetical protein ACI9GW_002852, partial [Halieaceae bacterium]
LPVNLTVTTTTINSDVTMAITLQYDTSFTALYTPFSLTLILGHWLFAKF